ncbi:uncharacterized protein LOC105691698 isoform X2 [Athalia rosae]|uniref:uncharacterized protein LOC105691698 isoform X2 n=1 Tax=Athalia rosae TaxID=37344 RepID=UPI0020347B7A|nr:uncharacterized protein LOC105691698 isoform X2 [Athalia rosae]
MDGKLAETTKEVCKEPEPSNLIEVTAGLEMLTVKSNISPNITRRVLRKRVHQPDVPVTANRRCSQKPRKRAYSEMETDNDVKQYYLDKSLKLSPTSLETILEEKKGTSESNIYIGAKKFRRMIKFQVEPTASKIKKRRAKVKKIFGRNINNRLKRTTMQALLDKLNNMQPESSPDFAVAK